MRAITGIGIAGAFAALLLAVIMEGGNPASLIDIPAFIIAIIGTIAATAASTNVGLIGRMPKLLMIAIKGSQTDLPGSAAQMVQFAEKARREGLLALERDLGEVKDDYAKKGLQLIVDGTDSELVSQVLEAEIDGLAQRHAANAHIWTAAGGFAPTLGIIGTVLSLVHVLENLSSPASLGHSIAGAFLATLYGVSSANLFYLPVGAKLKELSAEEVLSRTMLLEAILGIQAGDNPRLLAERLETFIPPAQRGRATAKPAVAAVPDAVAAEAA